MKLLFETREIELPDFAIAKYPVTFGQYGEFLNSLPEEEAEARKPYIKGSDEPYMERGEDGHWRPLAHIVEGPAHDRCLAEHGEGFERNIPVMGISFEDARDRIELAVAHRGGAGEGGAGRGRPAFPLGRPGGPEPREVPGLAGRGRAAWNVWDWTDSWFDERRSLRVLRGGAWYFGSTGLRCGLRLWGGPRLRLTGVGLRCARGLQGL